MMSSALAFYKFGPEVVLRWVETGGYATLFSVLFACGLGLPMPEDVPLLAAGYMMSIGRFHLLPVAICAWCGIIGGDCILYLLGRRYGMEVTKVPFIGGHLTLKRIEWVRERFSRYGVWVVAVGRMLAGIRGAMVVCAGAIRYPFWKFLLADGLAAVVSGGLFLALGFWFGKKMDVLMARYAHAKHWLLLASIVAAIGLGIWVWLKGRPRPAESSPPV